MRIGILAPPWLPVPPARYGGTEAVIDRLARGLAAGGHDVLLWTTGDATCPVPRGHVLDEAATHRMGDAGIEVHHVVHGYQALAAWGPDLVHDHTLTGPLLGPSRVRAPIVTTAHGPLDGELRTVYGAAAPLVPLVAISRDQASRAIGLRVASIIHHGIEVDQVPVGDGGGDEDGPYHLFLGRMAPEKGVRDAVLAARQAGVRLLIAAKMHDRPEREYFERWVAPLLDDRIRYVGEVGPEEKLRLLGGATSLVNPIRWAEPFGLVMIEALACGTPVLAYPEGSAPELVDDLVTGFLCCSVDDLAEHLRLVHLLDRRRCRAAAEARFTAERMVADHVACYREVLARQATTAA